MSVNSFGAFCFGAVVGWFCYRTVIRNPTPKITDLAAMVGVIGGAAITKLFNPADGDLFGWYAIGLAAGTFVYFVVFREFNGKKVTAGLMDRRRIDRPPTEPGPDQPVL